MLHLPVDNGESAEAQSGRKAVAVVFAREGALARRGRQRLRDQSPVSR